MKQNYKAFAPDISSGGTTIKDVGKQRLSRKHTNPFKLWKLLICLMAVLMPVGVWAEGENQDNPLTGKQDRTISFSSSGNYYIRDLKEARIKITANDVVLNIAGENTFEAEGHNSLPNRGINALEIVNGITNFTIKHWPGETEPATLIVKSTSGYVNNYGASALDFHDNNLFFNIEGAVLVKVKSGNGAASGGDVRAMYAPNTTIKLSQGSCFSYHDDHSESSRGPQGYEIVDFASVGGKAVTNTSSHNLVTTVQTKNLEDKFTTANGAKKNIDGLNYYVGTFDSKPFIAPDIEQDGQHSFKFLRGTSYRSTTYYGELAGIPFPIKSENGDNMIVASNVGAALAGGNYYATLNQLSSVASPTLNVGKFSHSGELTASTTNITLSGTADYKTLNTTDKGFTLNGNTHTLTLSNLTIPTGNTVYVNGDVRLDQTQPCTIAEGVTKFNRPQSSAIDVYYYTANVSELGISSLNEVTITTHQNYPNLPITFENNTLHMWLPNVPIGDLKLQITKKSDGNAIYVIDTETPLQKKHGTTLNIVKPKVQINHTDPGSVATPYSTIGEAFKEVHNGETIQLEADYTWDTKTDQAIPGDNIKTGESFTLDLNGHTLTIGNNPLISGGQGKLILANSTGSSTITGAYRIGGEGGFYTDLQQNIGTPKVGETSVYRTTVSSLDQIQNVDEPVSYKVGGTEVFAAKSAQSDQYCFWLPIGNATNKIQHNSYTVAELASANIGGAHNNTANATPVFDIASGDIKVTSTQVYFGGISSGSDYRYSVSGTYNNNDNRATIISTSDKIVTGNHIEVDGAFVTLNKIDVQSGEETSKSPLTVNGTSNIKIVGENKLKGLGSQPAINLEDNASLTLTQDQTGFDDAGYLDVKSSSETAAIYGENATLTFDGGTLWAHKNSGSTATPMDAIEVQTAKYKMGSVYAKFSSATRFQDDSNNALYLLSITVDNAGPLQVNEAQNYVYASSTGQRVYLWQQKSDDGSSYKFKTRSGSTQEIPYTAIQENDDNAAPAAVLLKGIKDNTESDLGTYMDLKDISDKIYNENNNYDSFRVLTQINLTQAGGGLTVYGKPVTLDLNGHTISGKSEATLTGNTAWLTVVNGGYLKEDFNIEGNQVFIDKTTHLTQEARFKKDGKSVARVLLSGLPVGESSYRYTFGSNNGTFAVREDGTACLWVPTTSVPAELTINIGNIQYTAGEMTTELHKLDYINVRAKDVVAQVIPEGQTTGTFYKTLAEALTAAKTLENSTVKLWDNIATPNVEAEGTFTIDLNGFQLSNQANAFISIKNDNSRITIDNLSTTEGSRAELTDLSIVLSTAGNQLHVTEKVDMADNCKVKVGTEEEQLWRTWFYPGSSSQVGQITYDGQEYVIKNNVACLWLPKAESKKYSIAIGDASQPTEVSAIINASHYNEMRVGQQDEAMIVGTNTKGTLANMFTQAASGETIKLLKSVEISTDISLEKENTYVTLDLDRFNLTAQSSAKIILTKYALTVVAQNYNRAALLAPVQIGENGLLYIRSTLDASKIGEVTNHNDIKLYRLSVIGIPTVTQGKYGYDINQTGYFFNRVTGSEASEACLWLPSGEVTNLQYSDNVTTDPQTKITDKITIIAKHDNRFILGTNGVAEVVGGSTYSSLEEAIQALDGSTGTIRLLQNISVSTEITVNGKIEIDMDDKTIMGNTGAKFTVSTAARLHIIGNGAISAVDFTAEAATIGGNANLSVDRSVDMNDVCTVNVNNAQDEAPDANRYRLIVDGMTANTQLDIFYAGAKGSMTTDENGALCIWSQNSAGGDDQNSFTLQSKDGQTWTAQGITIEKNHDNYIKVSTTDLVASVKEANGTTDHECTTLEEAFRIAGLETVPGKGIHQSEILLRRNLTELTGTFKPACTNENITFNLNNMNIASDNATFKSNGKNILILKNGTLTGDITIPVAFEAVSANDANIFADKTLNMDKVNVHGTYNNNNVTLWRTLIKLPDGGNASEIKYSLPSKGTTGSSECIVDGYACVWFTASNTTIDVTFTVNDVDYEVKNLIITASHGNEINLNDLSPVASIGENDQAVNYASLAAALAKVQDGETIKLLKDLVLSTSQTLPGTPGAARVTLDLNGKNLSFTSGGFNVVNKDQVLTITNKNGAHSTLTGIINLTGEGDVEVHEQVTIGGIVMKHSTEGIKTVYRLIAKDPQGTFVDNDWIETPERDTDIQIGIPTTHEYTVPAGLANHSTIVTAYKVETITEDAKWDNKYANCNIILEENAVWDVTSATTATTIHRLTINAGATVKADGAKITATDGIRYIRTFNDTKWQLIALPYTASDITTTIKENGKNKVVSLSPASNPGTSGHFWLHTIKSDGSTADVTGSEMTANEVYLMAVPAGFEGVDKKITFISGPNQMLRRDQVLNPDPISGFVAYANGTLGEVTLDKQFYKLTDEGADQKFVRVEESALKTTPIDPFSGYLLADAATTQVVAKFSLRSTPTANDEIVVPEDKLQVRTEKGRIILTAEEPVQVVICDMKGVVKFIGEVPTGDSSYEVGAGIHIVNNHKVIVK